MEEKNISLRNLKFMLYDVYNIEELIQYPYYEDHDRESFDLIIETAMDIAKDMLLPFARELDQNPPVYSDGKVTVHHSIKPWLRKAGEDGWISAEYPYELGGQQIPGMIALACKLIFGAASFSALPYPGLNSAAGRVIVDYCNDHLKETYLPNILNGTWQGTMAMTEPQAGSSLADLRTQATPTEEGYYLIEGQKIFISAGDHDAADNIVNLVLARIKGAPAGVKGLSLFVVPKYRVEPDGKLVPNDVTCAGIFHKMGYSGCVNAHLSFGDKKDCRGYLIGEENKGLSYMFDMMNEARLGVGMAAIAIASAAYYNSLAYAKERLQGRPISSKDPNQPQIPLIEHADIRRMLLQQRAIVEGSQSLIFQLAKYADMTRGCDGKQKERYELLLDLLTPIAKTYPSEMGVVSVSQGLQILGGSGYCQDYPMEQYYREMRSNPIHEGTTGIQGIDLLGRKVVMKTGKAFKLFIEEVQKTIDTCKQDTELAPYADRLQQAMAELQKVTSKLITIAAESPEIYLADAVLYLEMFGVITIAWSWLVQGISIQKALKNKLSEGDAKFFNGKWHTLKYFFHYELSKTKSLCERLMETDGLTVNMQIDYFED